VNNGILSEILTGRREPTPGILATLGLQRSARLYVPVAIWPPEEAYDSSIMSREENE
jgi:hypothetical protein